MIDWHSHILPGVDDGSKDVEESLIMLNALKEQNIDTVIATPHFFANDESVDEFLERRNKAFEKLNENLTSDMPQILCGAEVKYYPGISRMQGLEKLLIGSTNKLLLEMPLSKWTDYTVKEVIELSSLKSITVILAHIERFYDMQDRSVFPKLLDAGVLMQVNSSFFEGFFSRKKAIKLLTFGMIHFIGSDCHNNTTRSPKIEHAYKFITKKFGSDFILDLDNFGYQALGH